MNIKSNSPAYWAVYPDFLMSGVFTIDKRNVARIWCKENCQNLFQSSDLYSWAFLDKSDAERFAQQFGGEIKYKPEQNYIKGVI